MSEASISDVEEIPNDVVVSQTQINQINGDARQIQLSTELINHLANSFAQGWRSNKNWRQVAAELARTYTTKSLFVEDKKRIETVLALGLGEADSAIYNQVYKAEKGE